MQTLKKTILSGIQPSNVLHLGNYLGAVRNWLGMQDEYNSFYMMVDLHAITVAQDPAQLREASYLGIATYLAAGLDPEKVTLFLQSHVPAHSQLAWMLTCSAYIGELSRMTQYKDKTQKHGQNIPAGLFVYPCLMAADILLYQADLVPVGDDQKQHIELTRNLAERLNNRCEDTLFRVPEPFIGPKGKRVMDLQEPTNKMSKSSQNQKGVVYLTDTDKQISKKLKSAVTDSGSEFGSYENASPGLRNLIDILAAIRDKDHQTIASEFEGKQYGHLKVAAADAVRDLIAPMRDKANQLLDDKGYLDQVLKSGAERANEVASKTLKKVSDAFGFIAPI